MASSFTYKQDEKAKALEILTHIQLPDKTCEIVVFEVMW